MVTRLLRSRRRLSDLDAPRPYLMRAVLNESLNRRKETAREAELADYAVEPKRSDPDVLAAVVALPPQQRAAVYLSYWGDMTSDEVADLMGCRPATVRRYLHLAKRRLEGVLRDE